MKRLTIAQYLLLFDLDHGEELQLAGGRLRTARSLNRMRPALVRGVPGAVRITAEGMRAAGRSEDEIKEVLGVCD